MIEIRADEGIPGRERRHGREQSWWLVAGGRCIFIRRAHSIIVRMAG